LLIAGVQKVADELSCAHVWFAKVFNSAQTSRTSLSNLHNSGVLKVPRVPSSSDGCFATLIDMVKHYDAQFGLNLSRAQKNSLVERLKEV